MRNMVEAKFLEHVKGLGEVFVAYAAFPQQIQALNAAGIKTPVSVRDASYVRLHGENREYTRTCHAPVCAKDSPTIVARMSPLIQDLQMAEQAVQAHRKGQYSVFDKDFSIYAQWEKIAKEDKKSKRPEQRRAIILAERADFDIHTDSDEARFFWQDTRKDYFRQYVSKGSVPCWQIPVSDVDSASGTIINYVGLCRIVNGSDLYFRYRNLDLDYRALGVLRKSAEGASQKIKQEIKLPYTRRQVEGLSELIKEVRAGNLPASKLEKVLKFLENLKQ